MINVRKRGRTIVCALALGMSLNIAAAPPASRPTTGTASPKDTAAQALPADTELLLKALRDGDFNTVIDAATTGAIALRKAGVKPLDGSLANVQHLHAVALGRQGRVKLAADMLQRIAPLAGSNRSLLFNLAISDLADLGLLPRSIKNLQTYASANPTDEDAINLWGAAMAKLAGANKVSDARLKEWETAYNAVNSQLEAARADRWRHWGSQWISRDEYAVIERNRRNAQSRIDGQKTQVKSADRAVEAARRDLARVQSEMVVQSSRYWGDWERREHDRRVASCEEALQRALNHQTDENAKLKDANDAMPRPTWLAAAVLVEPELFP